MHRCYKDLLINALLASMRIRTRVMSHQHYGVSFATKHAVARGNFFVMHMGQSYTTACAHLAANVSA